MKSFAAILLTTLAASVLARTPVRGAVSVAPLTSDLDFRTKPAIRKLAADGLTFASVGCQASNAVGPYEQFMPACIRHLRELIAEVDRSYTDIQLESVLKHECWMEKQFPKSCDSGFDKEKHCHEFSKKLVAARDEELETGKTDGYKTGCEDYFVLRGGSLKQDLKDEAKFEVGVPMFNEETMPPVSTTLHCISNLALQYFGIYTALAIVRTLVSFKFNLVGVQQILEAGCTTVTFAPMLCVLFLGARMRAIQLSQGETEKYKLPQPWVQTSMIIASHAVVGQVVLVLLVGFLSGMSKVSTDAEGHLDVSQMADAHPLAVKVLTALRYVVMAMLYGGFTAVVVGVFMMRGPKEIWGNQEPPVSPAVMCTIFLSGMFFLVYLLVAITKTCFEVSRNLRQSPVLLKLEASAASAKMTVNFAPMLCILFVGARMRALQIDPKNGNPQRWAQNCFFMCTFSVLIQALLVIILPFVANGECRRGAFEGDVAFTMKNPRVGAVMTSIRYLCLIALYGGIAAVVYSVFAIQHPKGPSMTPPVSPAMHCVIALTAQYFLVFCLLFVCITIKSFVSGPGLRASDAEQNAVQRFEAESPVSKAMSRAIAILDAARSTVMFAPMLSILFIGARMRALQLAKDEDGRIPPSAGPQKWVQDAMYLATWAVFVQLIMTMLVPVLTGTDKPESDQDGNVKVPPGTHKYLAIFVEVVRYINLINMYIGATCVVVGVFLMTPQDVQPYSNKPLVPGVDVPQPPVPSSAK